jgi:glycosyltransferase involved in cell wall biosynthesis
MAMRVDMVSEHASPLAVPGGVDAGGQNVHVRELAQALARLGHEVTVWTRRDDPELPDRIRLGRGLQVRHLSAGPARPLPKDELVAHVPAMADALVAAWRRRRPDLVHAHYWMSGLAVLTAAEATGVPVVQTFHALGSVKRRHQGRADTSPDGRIAAERTVAQEVDRIIATCSDEVFELVRLGAPRHRIRVVPCGVDTEGFTPNGPALPRGDRPRLVSVGRLVRRKGVDETIAALAQVPGTELVVAGGSGPDDPDRRRLAALAAEHRVEDRVGFLGAMPRARMPELLRSADVVICVPWYEPFGMVPLEAMACARPVVASAVGGLTDTVVDGATGILVPPRSPSELAAAVRRLLAAPGLTDALGAAGRDRAVARYGWDRVAAATADVYDQVVALGPVARAAR